MSFLTTIRNSFVGTTHFLQNAAKGKWGFFALFLLTFGIVQIATFILFLFVLIRFVDNNRFDFLEMLSAFAGGEMQAITGFVALYILFFMVVMIKKSRSLKDQKLSFNSLFQLIPGRTYGLFFGFTIVSLALVFYASSYFEWSFFSVLIEDNEYYRFQEERKWYSELFMAFSAFFLRYLPAIVLGYYAVSLKEGRWKWSFVGSYWKTALAVLAVSIMFTGLYNVFMQFVSRTFLQTIGMTLQNEVVVLFVTAVVTFVAAAAYYGVLGSLVYFAVHDESDEEAEQEALGKGDSDILDQ